jgi:hypothetical protein
MSTLVKVGIELGQVVTSGVSLPLLDAVGTVVHPLWMMSPGSDPS